MRRPAFVFALLFATSLFVRAKTPEAPGKITYPAAHKGSQVDDYHGTKVADPYRWLENPDAPESRQWIEAENKLTFRFLDGIPERPAIKARLKELWDYEKFGVPEKEQTRFFFTKNSGLQNQSVIYTTENLAKPPQVLLDPNTLSQDGTVALAGSAVSEDARLFAYGLAAAGSDWQEWKVRDVATGKDTTDDLNWVKFSGASWKKDGSGFFYSHYDPPKGENKLRAQVFNQKLYFHKLGTPQAKDQLVYERPDHKDWLFGGNVTEDGRYLIIEVSQGTDSHKRVFYQDLTEPDAQVIELLPKADASWQFIGNDGPVFWFKTDLDAPLGRIVAIDTTKPLPAQPNELVAESADKLEGVSLVGERFVGDYLKDAHSLIKLYQLDGSPDGEIALPGLGSAAGFSGKRADRETLLFLHQLYTGPDDDLSLRLRLSQKFRRSLRRR